MNNPPVPASSPGGASGDGPGTRPVPPAVTTGADPGEYLDDDPPDEASGDAFEPL